MPDRKSDDAKFASLKEQGTLNPRSDDVNDPLFAGSSFFDSRDLVQVKYEMLRSAQIDGKPVTHCAATFGFSRPSFYQAQNAFSDAGLGGLIPRKRGPRTAHKLTEEVMGFLEDQLQADASLRPVDLTKKIFEHFGIIIHPRSVERALGRHEKKT